MTVKITYYELINEDSFTSTIFVRAIYGLKNITDLNFKQKHTRYLHLILN